MVITAFGMRLEAQCPDDGFFVDRHRADYRQEKHHLRGRQPPALTPFESKLLMRHYDLDSPDESPPAWSRHMLCA